jgi:sec-independent protein translocase protein TatA
MFLRNGVEPGHLLLVALVVLLLFGSRKLPDTARSLGKSFRILKAEARAMKHDGQPEPSASPAPARGRSVRGQAPGGSVRGQTPREGAAPEEV